MTESNRSTVVGVFADESQADLAVNELRTAGFRNDQINLEVRRSVAGDEDISEQNTESQEGYGVAGVLPTVIESQPVVSHSIVTVLAEGREEEALSILQRNGANNANIPHALQSDLPT